MPWHVGKPSECPASKPYGVIKDSDGSVVACHPTKAKADKHMAALYANEDSADSANAGSMVGKTARAGEGMTTTTAAFIKRAENPPTDRLLRISPFAVRSASADPAEEGDGLTLDGYASVFNQRTLIDSWEGRFFEEVAPGAMKKTFREQTPKLQFDHGTHPMIGSMPIGAIRSIAEDTDPDLAPDGGAHVVARLFDNWLIEPVRDAIREQAVDGMSFRFSVVKEDWKDQNGKRITDPQELHEALYRSWREDVPDEELLVRTLRELRVPELGPVVFPAYGGTQVDVRSGRLVIDLGAVRRGDPQERKKLAEALFLADDSRAKNPDPEVQGQGNVGDAEEPAPASTAPDAAAASHAESHEAGSPASTADTAAASHEAGAARRRTLDVALDRIRGRVLDIPSEPPSGLK